MTRLSALKCAASLLAIAVGTSTAGGALAQNSSPAAGTTDAAPEQTVDAIVVTGSRVASGADAPTPVTAVTPEMINQVEQPNIADALTQLPALRSSNTAAKGGEGGSLGSSLNLRGLGPLRTLTLVNGQRFVPTMQFGLSTGSQAVNVDSLPQGLIKRVDVVTGGASAAYGSDAVAGVVNFVLDEKFQGFKAEVTTGETQRHDAKNYAADVSAGSAFAEGRGHVLVDFEYARDEGVPNDELGLHGRRDWMNDSRTVGVQTVGGVRQLVTGARAWQYPLNGLVDGCIVAGAQKGTACPLSVYGAGFDEAGLTTHRYDFGLGINPTTKVIDPNTPVYTVPGQVYAVGGEGSQPGPQSVIDTPSERHMFYGRVSYDLTPNTNVYLDVLGQETTNDTTAGHITPQFIDPSRKYGFDIDQSNPYIPADLLAQMQANNVSSISLSKIMPYSTHQRFEARTSRYSVGLKHEFNDNWSADAYYTYGQIDSTMTLRNFSNVNHLYNAIHSVRAPTDGASWKAGDIVCSSTLAGTLDGCTPWNPFGSTQLTAAQQAYISPLDYYFSTNTQEVAEASIKGSPFTLPAGPVDTAFGAGYRKETVKRTSDALGAAQLPNAFYPTTIGALSYLNNPAIQGSTHDWEMFGEAEVPLLKGLRFAQSLSANLAARYTDYSNGGGVTTWKAGLTYVPIEGLRFRGAYSRDVRAPNLIELFSPKSSGYATISDPANGNVTANFAPITSGTANLKPEQSNTLTLGVVFRPSFAPSVYASVDYYQIKMEDQIATRNAQTVANECTGTKTVKQVLASCDLITRGESNQIISINLPYANLASTNLSGFDVELGYDHPIDFYRLKGDISLHSYINYVLQNESVSAAGATPIDTAPQPARLTLLASADYRTGPWTFGLQEHFTSAGRRSVQIDHYVGDRLPSAVWTDLIVRRQINKYEVYGTIQNLFDKDPPINYFQSPNSGSASSGGDPLGRRFQIGVKVKL